MKSYINKVRANISIYASRKTANILEGSYKSIYKGKSLNFEDLREYNIGDNVKDIDWKASARKGDLLVRQYVAEKKHNILFVMDSGNKMRADTSSGDSKKEVSLMTAGSIAYIANKNGDYVSAIYSINENIEYYPFKSGLNNIEKVLSEYDVNSDKCTNSNMEKLLSYVSKKIGKKMIIFIITDLEGMEKIDTKLLKQLTLAHDVLVIDVDDAYITSQNAYDMENNSYMPKMLSNDKKLFELEKKTRDSIYNKCIKEFEKYRVTTIKISSLKDIVPKVIELLERHKNANIR